MTREEWLAMKWRSLLEEVDGAIWRHGNRGGQQCGPRRFNNVSLGALHELRREAKSALETTAEWFGDIEAEGGERG